MYCLDGRRRENNPFIRHVSEMGFHVSTVHLERDAEGWISIWIPIARTREFLDTRDCYTWVSSIIFMNVFRLTEFHCG